MSHPTYNHREWIAKVREFNAWLDMVAAKLREPKQTKPTNSGFEQLKKAMGL